MIRIVPPDDYAAARRGVPRRSSTFDWIVFSSANAVDAFMRRLLASPLDLRALGRRQAVRRRAGDGRAAGALRPEGRSRARRVSRRGDRRRRSRSRATSAACRVLLPRADIGREVVADELRTPGRATSPRSSPTGRWSSIPSATASPTSTGCCSSSSIDVVTFTSASAVRNFVRAVRRRAGRRPAAARRGGLDRPGDGGGRARSSASTRRSCRRSTPCRRWSTRSSSTSRRSAAP